MGFTRFPLSTLEALTPMLLLAVGVGHAMQVTRRFVQELERSGDAEGAAGSAIRHTIVPATLSVGTDLHGFFALSFVDISFYRGYACFGIFGMRKLRFGVEPGEPSPGISGGAEGGAAVGERGTRRAGAPGRAAIGGFLGVTEATRDVALAHWLTSPAATALTVFAMTSVLFRSVSIATPLVGLCFVSLLSQYGLGGCMTSIGEWSCNLAFHSQVALSIAMGLGVDYGVYVTARLREEMRATGGNWRQALEATLRSTGAAILVAGVVLLASLVPLMNTRLASLWSVSLYLGEALVLDVLMALVLLPLLLWWARPRYVFRREGDNESTARSGR